MENVCHLVVLYLGLLFLKICGGFPIDLESADLQNATAWTVLTPFLAVAFVLTSVVLILGCVCCRQNKGFQEFTDSTSSHSLSAGGGYVNSAASTTEFTIFPPVQAATATVTAAAPPPNRLSVPGDRSSVVRFEPLPDIRLPQPHGIRPAAFNNVMNHGLTSQDWFQDPHVNFPRQQLKYLRELGRGWFGRVVEGEAQNIVPEQKTTKVVVKILHEDATTTDQMYFLHEVKPYRELNHPNILKLLGRCLETDPFLVLLEACPSGDLKSFLSQNIATAEALNQQGVTLRMCCNIASGLLHMHDNGFVHTDLAIRNCLVTPDLIVKIGDYGTSIETFKEDYYCAGEVALPIRWCAPETLHCTETTIETKEVTVSANVWSLGVVLWEICEFGKLPYSELTDDEVIVKVLGEGNHRLGLPSLPCPQRQNLYLLMKLCWRSMPERPLLLQVHSMLDHLHTSRERYSQDGDSSSLKTNEDFERRWEMFKPNTIPKTDNHVISSENTPSVQSPLHSVVDSPAKVSTPEGSKSHQEEDDVTHHTKPLVLQPAAFESMVSSRDSGNLTVDGSSTTPLTTSPQPSLASSSGGEFFIPTLQHRHKSPSLQNLRGSIDDLSEMTNLSNWQKTGESNDLEHTSDILEEKDGEAVLLEEAINEKEAEAVIVMEPDFDSWLKGVETTNEEDAKFVRKISEAIRDLDNALALEKTSSSSSSEASSNSVSHQSPAKDITTLASEQNVVLDFRLGRADSGVSSDDKEMIFQTDSLQEDSFMEHAKSVHVENRGTDSGTDTEDETWRRRIERGEFSEKVKEKSKSVADLMVLTHIECSDGSDSDPPSLTWSFERSPNSRGSFTTRIRPGSFNKPVPAAFSSESNIHGAVLGEEFKDTLRKLHEAQRESSRLQRVNDRRDSEINISNHNREDNFLANDASEELIKKQGEEDKMSCPNDAKRALENNDEIGSSVLVNSELGFKVDANTENLTQSSSSQVPEDKCASSSISNSNSQDCSVSINVGSSVSESLDDNVPQIHVIEPSLHSVVEVDKPSDSSDVSDISLLATNNLSMREVKQDSLFESSSSTLPLFTSTPHPRTKMGTVDGINSVSHVLEYSEAAPISSTVSSLSPSRPYSSETSIEHADTSYSDSVSSSNIISDSFQLSPSYKILEKQKSAGDVEELPRTLVSSPEFSKILNSSSQENDDSVSTIPVETDVPVSSNKTDNEKFSGTPVSSFVPSVVLGPCEDYTLDYFNGLKTTSGGETDYDSPHSENISTYLGKVACVDERSGNSHQKPLFVDYCIDSWEKHISSAFQEHENKVASFDNISFKSGVDSFTDEDYLSNVNYLSSGTQESNTDYSPLDFEGDKKIPVSDEDILLNLDHEILQRDGKNLFHHDSSNVFQNLFSLFEDSQSENDKSSNINSRKPEANSSSAKEINSDINSLFGFTEEKGSSEALDHSRENSLAKIETCKEVLTLDNLPMVQEKVNTSGLCIPSLNFIAATPVPSGRNTPEMYGEESVIVTTENVNDEKTDFVKGSDHLAIETNLSVDGSQEIVPEITVDEDYETCPDDIAFNIQESSELYFDASGNISQKSDRSEEVAQKSSSFDTSVKVDNLIDNLKKVQDLPETLDKSASLVTVSKSTTDLPDTGEMDVKFPDTTEIQKTDTISPKEITYLPITSVKTGIETLSSSKKNDEMEESCKEVDHLFHEPDDISKEIGLANISVEASEGIISVCSKQEKFDDKITTFSKKDEELTDISMSPINLSDIVEMVDESKTVNKTPTVSEEVDIVKSSKEMEKPDVSHKTCTNIIPLTDASSKADDLIDESSKNNNEIEVNNISEKKEKTEFALETSTGIVFPKDTSIIESLEIIDDCINTSKPISKNKMKTDISSAEMISLPDASDITNSMMIESKETERPTCEAFERFIDFKEIANNTENIVEKTDFSFNPLMNKASLSDTCEEANKKNNDLVDISQTVETLQGEVEKVSFSDKTVKTDIPLDSSTKSKSLTDESEKTKPSNENGTCSSVEYLLDIPGLTDVSENTDFTDQTSKDISLPHTGKLPINCCTSINLNNLQGKSGNDNIFGTDTEEVENLPNFTEKVHGPVNNSIEKSEGNILVDLSETFKEVGSIEDLSNVDNEVLTEFTQGTVPLPTDFSELVSCESLDESQIILQEGGKFPKAEGMQSSFSYEFSKLKTQDFLDNERRSIVDETPFIKPMILNMTSSDSELKMPMSDGLLRVKEKELVSPKVEDKVSSSQIIDNLPSGDNVSGILNFNSKEFSDETHFEEMLPFMNCDQSETCSEGKKHNQESDLSSNGVFVTTISEIENSSSVHDSNTVVNNSSDLAASRPDIIQQHPFIENTGSIYETDSLEIKHAQLVNFAEVNCEVSESVEPLVNNLLDETCVYQMDISQTDIKKNNLEYPFSDNTKSPNLSKSRLNESNDFAEEPIEAKLSKSSDLILIPDLNKSNENTGVDFFNIDLKSSGQKETIQLHSQELLQNVSKNKLCPDKSILSYEFPVEVNDTKHVQSLDIFSEKEANGVTAMIDSWKNNQFDNNSRTLMEDFLLGERLASGLTVSGLEIKSEGLPEIFDTVGEAEEDSEDFGLDAVKHSTPDDERSSDSGFRDKGSLSESCEDACDEKYNLEDIEAELEETFNKGGFSYVDKHDDGEQIEHVHEDMQRKLPTGSSDVSALNCFEKTEQDGQKKQSPRSCCDSADNRETLEDDVMLQHVKESQKDVESFREATLLEEAIDEEKLKEMLGIVSDTKANSSFLKLEQDMNSHYMSPEFFHQDDLMPHMFENSKPDSLNLSDDSIESVLVQPTGEESIKSFANSSCAATPCETGNLLDFDFSSQKQAVAVSEELQQVTKNIIPLTPKNSLQDEHHLVENISADKSTQISHENNLETFTDIVNTEDVGLEASHIGEDISESGVESESESRDLQRETTLTPTSGWYLHPPPKSGSCDSGVNYSEEDERSNGNAEEYPSPTNSGSCSNNSENSYVSFSLDEEFVNAIRNELREKLPITSQQNLEEDSEEDEILDPDDDLTNEDRTDIMIHYNTYPAPLSPILEERESVSSVTTTISDHYSPFASSVQRDVTKSGSDSEPMSPVFILDSKDEDSRAKYELDAKKFEQEIREALENCSFSSSEDSGSSCAKNRKAASVLFEDLDQQTSENSQNISADVTVNGTNVVMIRGTNQHPEDDDLLVVNTETNEATLLESPKPKSHLAFVNSKKTIQDNKSIDDLNAIPDFVSDDEMTGGINSDTFIIEKNRFGEAFEAESKLNTRKEISSDDEVYTPDSISPEHATGTPASSLHSPDTENLSDFFLTPSEKSLTASDCPNSPQGPQNSAVYNPYFLHTLVQNQVDPSYEEVQEIRLVANNEAEEIISELENSGILLNNNNITNEKEVISALITPDENVFVQELPSSIDSPANDNSESMSVEESSESSESARKDFEENGNVVDRAKELSAVDRLEYLTSPNLDVFAMKMNESPDNVESHDEEDSEVNGNGYRRRLLLNDTLDLLKKGKESQRSEEDVEEERDWSLPNLEATMLSTKAPMPSPEEESWKQIPSMLAFSDLNEVMTRCGSDSISFSGTSNCVPYGGQTEVDEGDLMSTSFSINADPEDQDCYTPDWESDSDETNEEDNNSSSSGEFIWKEGDRESSVKAVDISASSNAGKPYEGLSDFPMEVIAEEEEDDDEDGDDDADGSSSSGSGTEFVPSAWNSEATPNRSALRSPDKKSDQKKNVSFKKQKYHCVYEYPRETSDSDSEGFDSPTRRHWNNLVYQSTQPQVDYASFADWDLMDGDVLPEGSGQDTDTDQDVPENSSQQQLDFYKLSSVDYDFGNGMMSEDGEFYITSTARPFQFTSTNSDVLSNGSQFFPGQLYHVSDCKPVDFVTPDSGIIDITSADKLLNLEAGVDSYEDEVDTSPSSISRFAVSFNDQLQSRKSNSIKDTAWEDEIDSGNPQLDKSSETGDKSVESIKPQESFSELDQASVVDSGAIVVPSAVISNIKQFPSSGETDSIRDKDGENMSQSPSSPLSPSGLGELRHTRDRLKLDLPTSSKAFVLDPPAVGKRRSVETVKGEASLLDSGEETEDSGIETSNGVASSLKLTTEDASKT